MRRADNEKAFTKAQEKQISIRTNWEHF